MSTASYKVTISAFCHESARCSSSILQWKRPLIQTLPRSLKAHQQMQQNPDASWTSVCASVGRSCFAFLSLSRTVALALSLNQQQQQRTSVHRPSIFFTSKVLNDRQLVAVAGCCQRCQLTRQENLLNLFIIFLRFNHISLGKSIDHLFVGCSLNLS